MAFVVLPYGPMFKPSEQILLTHYLRIKNENEAGNLNRDEVIKELIHLYSYDAFDLPEGDSFSFGDQGNFQHWYYFTSKVIEEKRMCKTGFWMKKGRVHEIKNVEGNEVLGTKTLFCFYVGNMSRPDERSDWIMYEYALAANPATPFVVCRIFDSEQALDLCSLQTEISDVDEIDIDENEDEEVNQPLRCMTGEENDSRAVNAPFPQDTQQGRLAELAEDDALNIEAAAAALEDRDLLFMQGNYIELNDLL